MGKREGIGKGTPGPGRPEGSKNERTKQWDMLVETLEGSQAENFRTFMASLWQGTKEDQITASNLYLKLLEFHKPKLQRTAMTGPDGDEMVIKFIQGAKPNT